MEYLYNFTVKRKVYLFLKNLIIRHTHTQGASQEEMAFPHPGDLPDPVIEAASPALEGRFFTTETPGKPPVWFGFGQINLVQRNLSTALLYPRGHLC